MISTNKDAGMRTRIASSLLVSLSERSNVVGNEMSCSYSKRDVMERGLAVSAVQKRGESDMSKQYILSSGSDVVGYYGNLAGAVSAAVNDKKLKEFRVEHRGYVVYGMPVAAKTVGQVAYEQDLVNTPNYLGGSPRPQWEKLSGPVQWSWERNPTARESR